MYKKINLFLLITLIMSGLVFSACDSILLGKDTSVKKTDTDGDETDKKSDAEISKDTESEKPPPPSNDTVDKQTTPTENKTEDKKTDVVPEPIIINTDTETLKLEAKSDFVNALPPASKKSLMGTSTISETTENQTETGNTQNNTDVDNTDTTKDGVSPISSSLPPIPVPISISYPSPSMTNIPFSKERGNIIEQGDLVKIEGSNLFVLNPYTGFLIISLEDISNPQIIGRLALKGQAMEMYIHKDIAYVVFSDYGVYSPEGYVTPKSRLMAIGFSDRSKPVVIKEVEISGTIAISKLTGELIYIIANNINTAMFPPPPLPYGLEKSFPVDANISVSGEDPSSPAPGIVPESTVSILSFNLPDLTQIDEQKIFGFLSQSYFTSEKIFLALSDPNLSFPNIIFYYLNISDSSGKIALGDKITLEENNFGPLIMNFFNGYFHTVSSGQDGYILNIFKITTAGKFEVVTNFKIDSQNYVREFRFDENKLYVLGNTKSDNASVQVIDLDDPANPKLSVFGNLENVGWNFKIYPRGNRLITLTENYQEGNRLIVSLYDMTKLEETTLLSQLTLGDENFSSSVFYDENAFKFMEELNLILLNFSNWNEKGPTNTIKLIDLNEDKLIERGFFTGLYQLNRLLEFSGNIIAIAPFSLYTININDRDTPEIKGSLTLVANIMDFTVINGAGIRLESDYYSPVNMTIKVVPLDDPENGKTLAKLTLPENFSYNSMFVNGNFLYLSGMKNEITRPIEPIIEYKYEPPVTEIIVIDFNNISNPILSGKLSLPSETNYYSPPMITQLSGNLFLAYSQKSDYRDIFGLSVEIKKHIFSFVDLSDSNNPKISSKIEKQGYVFPHFIYRDQTFYLTSYNISELTSKTGEPLAKFYLHRINLADLNNPQNLDLINIPGVLIDLSADNKYLYTQDFQWEEDKKEPISNFNILQIVDDKAYLLDTLPINDTLYGKFIIKEGYAYFTTTPFVDWSSSINPEEQKTKFHILDLNDPKDIKEIGLTELSMGNQIFEVKNNLVFFTTFDNSFCSSCLYPYYEPMKYDMPYYSGGQKLSILNLADNNKPVLIKSFDINPTGKIFIQDGKIYLANGFSGMEMLDY